MVNGLSHGSVMSKNGMSAVVSVGISDVESSQPNQHRLDVAAVKAGGWVKAKAAFSHLAQVPIKQVALRPLVFSPWAFPKSLLTLAGCWQVFF